MLGTVWKQTAPIIPTLVSAKLDFSTKAMLIMESSESPYIVRFEEQSSCILGIGCFVIIIRTR